MAETDEDISLSLGFIYNPTNTLDADSGSILDAGTMIWTYKLGFFTVNSMLKFVRVCIFKKKYKYFIIILIK